MTWGGVRQVAGWRVSASARGTLLTERIWAVGVEVALVISGESMSWRGGRHQGLLPEPNRGERGGLASSGG